MNQYAGITHCKHGHAFTPTNTYWWTKPNGRLRRQCKRCKAIRDQIRNLKHYPIALAPKA